MAFKSRMLRATALAAPLGALALSAQAADVASAIQEQQQFSTLAKAIESAGLVESLKGEGPYTVFAPTDEAFEQLPEGALDELMKQENQDQLKSLVQYHVIEGQKIAAKDAIGDQTEVDTLSGDKLSVDGTGQMVMLVPTGLTVTRVGDQVFVERDVAAVTAPSVEISPAGSGQQGQQSGQQGQQPQAQTSGSGGSAEQQTAASGQSQQQSGQQSGQGDTQTQTAEQSGMPASEHQEQVLATQPSTEQQQTMPQDSGMPSTPHQEQVLQGQQPGEQQGQQATPGGGQQDTGALRHAMVVEPDIEADNGVIHAIDAVLIPQSVLSMIEQQEGRQGQSGQSQTQQSTDKQG